MLLTGSTIDSIILQLLIEILKIVERCEIVIIQIFIVIKFFFQSNMKLKLQGLVHEMFISCN